MGLDDSQSHTTVSAHCTYRLEPNEWDLHGTQESHNKKSIVCDINAMGDSVHQDKCENVKRDKVDDKNISSPCGYLKEENKNLKNVYKRLLIL